MLRSIYRAEEVISGVAGYDFDVDEVQIGKLLAVRITFAETLGVRHRSLGAEYAVKSLALSGFLGMSSDTGNRSGLRIQSRQLCIGPGRGWQSGGLCSYF